MRLRTSSAGFTLIELLVVIAIIGILSAVVLASLGTARTKGNDASVRADLTNARSQAELFYLSNNNVYVVAATTASDMCASAGLANGVKGVYPIISAAANVGGSTINPLIGVWNSGASNTVTCHATATAWGIDAPLKGTYTGFANPFFCVDSTGFAGVVNASTLAAGDPKCN